MIELKKVSKSYGEKVLFDNFDCNVKKGEFVGIKGCSGSGKSTLLNIMGLLEKCDSGDIMIDGNKVDYTDKKTVKKLLKTHIGYLFQNFALIDDFTVLDNLSIGISGNKSEKADKIRKVLKDLNLDVDLNKKIFKLSGGEQQRIAIARLILQNKPIILADEPTASVDPKNRDIILDTLKKLNKEGKTIVLVSHDDYVIEHTDRIIFL